MSRTSRWSMLGAIALLWMRIAIAAPFSADTHDVYAGDFNGDGKSDLLVVAQDPAGTSGIYASDASGQPAEVLQSWNSGYLGISWHERRYTAVIGNFDGVNGDDVLLQRNGAGTSFLLPTNGQGELFGISQYIHGWGSDTYRIVAGDFEGNAREDVFLQARTSSGSSAVVLSNASGHLSLTQQRWSNGHLGFKWSVANARVHTGDFNGDGRDDLLVQAKPDIASIDYEVPILVPLFKPNSFGITLATPAGQFTSIHDAFSRKELGLDFAPGEVDIVLGDFNGDGRDDILLLARRRGKSSTVVLSDSNGQLTQASVVSLGADTLGAELRSLAADFNGDGRAEVYRLTSTGGGSNSLVSFNSSGGIAAVVTNAPPPLSLSAPPTLSPGTVAVPGAIAASAEVSDTGAARYDVPLVVPPGPNGLQPQLSLSYDSRGGDGPLGPGWSLAGLSAISRCSRSVGLDGAVAPVTLTYRDAFCLDGERLRLVDAPLSQYGQPGTTYDTELAKVAQITAVGAAGNGPAAFVMKAANGLIYEFGNTPDARILPSTSMSTAYVWLLNQVSDRAGNRYLIRYSTGAPGSVGIGVPTSIRYAPTSVGGSDYTHAIEFLYAAKGTQMPGTTAPSIVGFVAGMEVVNTNLLLGINVSIAGTLTRRYALGYEGAPATARVRLATITECAGSEGTQCFAPTRIAYQDGVAGISATPITAATPGSNGFLRFAGTGDLNGDGRSDVLYSDFSTVFAVLSTEGRVSAPIPVGPGAGAVAVDAVGAGRADVFSTQAGLLARYVWHGAGFSAAPTGIPIPENTTFALQDVDADGRRDLVTVTKTMSVSSASRVTTNTIATRLNTSVGGVLSFSPTVSPAGSTAIACGSSSPNFCSQFIMSGTTTGEGLDFNGDGRKDLFELNQIIVNDSPQVTNASTLIYDGERFVRQPTILLNGGFFGFADWNDDACTDLISNLAVFISACNGLAAASVSYSGMMPVATLDWNGDGRTDLLVADGSRFGVLQSTGTGVSALIPTSIPLPSPAASFDTFVLDYDGDGQTDLGTRTSSAILIYPHNSPGVPPDLATAFTDGQGVTFRPTYRALARGPYQRGSDAVYPAVDYVGSLYVVASAAASTGLSGPGALALESFEYQRGRWNVLNRGFEGFEVKTSRDSRTGLYTRESFNREFPFTGTVKRLEVLQPDGTTLIARTQNTWSAYTEGSGFEVRSLPYLARSVEERYEVGGPHQGALISTATTTNTVDRTSGAVTETMTTLSESATANGAQAGRSYTLRTHTPALLNDVSTWCLGRPKTIEQTNSHTGAGGTPLTRTSSVSWDAQRCRPSRTVIEPGDAQWQVSTDIAYDDAGNPNVITVTPAAGQGQAARTTRLSWGADGRFPRIVTNPHGQATQFGWSDAYGARTSVIDPNNLAVRWQYDVFGRMTRQQLPDGTATDVVRSACGPSHCGVAELRTYLNVISRDAANQPIRSDAVYLDAFDRERFSVRQLLSGASSTVATTYDALGRLASQSTPYLSASDAVWYTRYSYDGIGRPTQIQRPTSEVDGRSHLTQFSYLGLTAQQSDALGRTTRRVFDVLGQVVQSLDATGADTDYEYDAFGQLLKTRDVAGNEIVLSYNVRGFKMSSNDPDLGAWRYTYFPLGELKSQTTARDQTVSFTYDQLSRPLTRSEPEGQTTWRWDTAAFGIGQLASVSSPGYSRANLYDSVGRLSQQNLTLEGVTHTIQQTYNAQGLLDTLTYPTSTAGVRFKVRYGYAHGLVQNVRDYTGDVLGTMFWQVNATDANGQFIDETLGNGVRTRSSFDRLTGVLNARTAGVGAGTGLQNLAYRWDAVGNLTQRRDLRQSLTEDFAYDALDRLERSSLNGVMNLQMAYDALGNITNKSDVGAYTYDPIKKHAVRTAGATTYTYDANGNAITRQGESLTWTSYDLPSLINGAGGNSSAFAYDAERQRFKQQASYAGRTETTLYIGGILEKVSTEGVDAWRHHILAANGEVAIHTRQSTGVNTTQYLSKDHLGSTEVISDATGTATLRSSFDAFGRRRNAAGWRGAPTAADLAALENSTRHGYTGHEMLDNLNLTHMNGRVYDPTTARFLSADPFVQAPFNGQSLNRYSYVFNNPLSFTDPSGFEATCNPDTCGTVNAQTLPRGTITREAFVNGNRPQFKPEYRPPGTPPATGPVKAQDQFVQTVTAQTGAVSKSTVNGEQPSQDVVDSSDCEGAFTLAIGDGAAIPVFSPGLCQSRGDIIQDQQRIGLFLGAPIPPIFQGLRLARLALGLQVVPFGFKGAAAFRRFGGVLNDGLARAGFRDTKGFVHGSAVTGRSFKTGKPFDVERRSDFDIALAGNTIFEKAEALGIQLRSRKTRTGPLSDAEIENLGLTAVRDQLSKLAGRDVNFMIFKDAAGATSRAPSIPIP